MLSCKQFCLNRRSYRLDLASYCLLFIKLQGCLCRKVFASRRTACSIQLYQLAKPWCPWWTQSLLKYFTAVVTCSGRTPPQWVTGRFVHFHRVFTFFFSCSLHRYYFRALAMQHLAAPDANIGFPVSLTCHSFGFLPLCNSVFHCFHKRQLGSEGFLPHMELGELVPPGPAQWQSRCWRGRWQPPERSWGLNVVLSGKGEVDGLEASTKH